MNSTKLIPGFSVRLGGETSIDVTKPGNPQEIEGVLNPAAARGPDGKLYLFPRLVANGNYSRFGIARVLFNDDLYCTFSKRTTDSHSCIG